MHLLAVLLMVFLSSETVNSKIRHRDKRHERIIWERSLNKSPEDSVENPLFLTPLIQNNRIEEAKNLSRVNLFDIESYSGYMTVDAPFCGSNMFFWFFPADTNYTTAPLTIWLQGGPGVSSIFGLLFENSPVELLMDLTKLKIRRRVYSWTKFSSMLYIDNPVGTMFSQTKSEKCYSKNSTHVASNLLDMVKQFLSLFPELREVELFIAGQSYAGKYIPALGFAILEDNKNKTQIIKLEGIAIGNGIVHPYYQMTYGNYLYNLGLIDETSRDLFLNAEANYQRAIQSKNWTEAVDITDSIILGAIPTLFWNSTKYFNPYNYLRPVPDFRKQLFLMNEFCKFAVYDLHASLHLDSFSHDIVRGNLLEDMPQSVAPLLEVLLENCRVLIYTGQMDLILNYPGVRDYVKNLTFSGTSSYTTAPRKPWYVGHDLAGYVKIGGKLTEVMVRNAGHIVPEDQPEWAFDLFSKFVRNQNLSDTLEDVREDEETDSIY